MSDESETMYMRPLRQISMAMVKKKSYVEQIPLQVSLENFFYLHMLLLHTLGKLLINANGYFRKEVVAAAVAVN